MFSVFKNSPWVVQEEFGESFQFELELVKEFGYKHVVVQTQDDIPDIGDEEHSNNCLDLVIKMGSLAFDLEHL